MAREIPTETKIWNGTEYRIPSGSEFSKWAHCFSLVLVSESLVPEERQYWFDIFPSMTDEQRSRLETILQTEQNKLAELEARYSEEIRKLNEKHLQEWEALRVTPPQHVVKVRFLRPTDSLLPRGSGIRPEPFFFHKEVPFPEHRRRHFQGRMDPFPVVVVDAVVDGLDSLFERGGGVQVAHFELEFPVVRLLVAILTRRSLGAHRRPDSGLRQPVENEETSVLASLVAVEDFRGFPDLRDGVGDGGEDEFLRADEADGVPDDLARIGVADAVNSFLETLPKELRKTVTFDNGREFAYHAMMAVEAYFSWERGTNENWNGLLREFFPKLTDFATVSQKDVTRACRSLNSRPRKRLGYLTPEEAFRKEMKSCVSV